MPTVLSWQLDDGYAASFDYPGTWDYAGWLAAADGLAYWEALGGWDAVARLADVVTDGQRRVAEALGVTLELLPATPAPAMRLVPLPVGVLTSPDQVDPFYEALSQQRVEVAPVHFDGVGYLRIAAAPYNTPDDYDRLADTVREFLKLKRTDPEPESPQPSPALSVFGQPRTRSGDRERRDQRRADGRDQRDPR